MNRYKENIQISKNVYDKLKKEEEIFFHNFVKILEDNIENISEVEYQKMIKNINLKFMKTRSENLSIIDLALYKYFKGYY